MNDRIPFAMYNVPLFTNPPAAITSWANVMPRIVVIVFLMLLIVSRLNMNHIVSQMVDRQVLVPSHTIELLIGKCRKDYDRDRPGQLV